MFNFTSPKKKAYSEMLQNAQPFLDKYKRITGYQKYLDIERQAFLDYSKEKFKFKYESFEHYWTLTKHFYIAYDDPSHYFLFCHSLENKQLKDKIRQVHNQNNIFFYFKRNEDKLYWVDIEECFREKYYPNIVTDMFDQDLKRSWSTKENITSIFNCLFSFILIVIFIVVITSPIWLQAVYWFR